MKFSNQICIKSSIIQHNFHYYYVIPNLTRQLNFISPA